MPVRDTSLIAFEKIKDSLEPNQQRVFEILLEIGPAHDNRILEALNQIEAAKPKRQRRKWRINQVTGRRNRLVGLGVVEDIGMFRGVWDREKKTYHFWRIKHDTRTPAGWVKVEKKITPHPAPAPQKKTKRRTSMLASEAGRVLRSLQTPKVRAATGQRMLF